MEVEHLATLEKLRQSQRQDYLKVNYLKLAFELIYKQLIIFPGFSFRISSSNGQINERIT